MDTVTWTDDKIDVLNDRVEALDGKVDTLNTRVCVLETKVDSLDARVRDGFGRAEVEYTRTDVRFEAVNQQLGDLRAGQAQLIDRFDAMQRTLVQVGFSLVVGLVGALVAMFALILTH